jgi:Kef-type K+ transport system membrane component KefB
VDLLTAIFLLLGLSVLAGELASRLGHVALVGQVVVGIILGPTLLGPYLGLSLSTGALASPLTGIQTIAVFFILFMAGLEVVPEDIWTTGGVTATLGILVFLVPFLLGAWLLPLLLPGPALPSTTYLFASLTLSITALPVMAVILIELDLLRSRLGAMVMGAAVVNELSAMTVFAILLEVRSGGGSVGGIATAVLGVALFILTILAVHQILKVARARPGWAKLQARLSGPLRKREVWFALLMVGAISCALYSEFLGLTYLIGAFYAGLLVTRESAGPVARRDIGRVLNTMTWGFFIPLFFAFVGLNMNLTTLLTPSWELAFLGVLGIACATKLLVGAAIPAAFGWDRRSSGAVASLVNGRGAVELAIATILLGMGVFSPQLFTLVAAVGLVTTILAPLGAMAALGGAKQPGPGPVSPEDGSRASVPA